ncbi:nicotinamide adenine dinucleotide transporter 1 [Cucumis melo var. makuwa]|uniref:Nicotinamide adenine dinucleotide transporter 1 n=2 Tax=Cucumis melo TaxID=3656 RepID=A0A5A7UED6_CUCMM|nr:nicotinamide adenine dinucleotide transporter 1 [Cucumis melo var. makuwa]
MYRGRAAIVLALLPNWAVYFTIYGQLKTFLGSDGANMMVAFGAKAATTIATNPLWVVKTKLHVWISSLFS